MGFPKLVSSLKSIHPECYIELLRPCAPCFIHHFTQYSDESFAGCLSLSVLVRVVRGRLVVLDLISVQQSSHMAVHKGGPIIRQHHFGYAQPTGYVFFDEVGHCRPICISHRYSLYPLGTNFSHCKYSSVAFGLLSYRTYQVKCPRLASPYKVFSIFFHCQPVVVELRMQHGMAKHLCKHTSIHMAMQINGKMDLYMN
ncbi:hypothetical protein CsSME_00047124 [Camellia sinensis var. sinensis]